MSPASKKISAASARAHTRGKSQSRSASFTSLLYKISGILLVILLARFYGAAQPPPPSDPLITSPRIKLSDGRYLSYLESGVPKEKANYKVIFIHGFDCNKFSVFPLSQGLIEELGIYQLSFDRAGYGESDPDPKKTERSTALDIEELADNMGLGSKFYVMGYSMGGEIAWSCLKYIPHRLAGVCIVAPVSNYWWPNFPPNVTKKAYSKQLVRDQWAVGVAHYAPWLVYWWNSQKWFPACSVIEHNPLIFSPPDLQILASFEKAHNATYVRQQGEFESLHRDMIVGFGSWEFDPMDLDIPFPNGEGSVQLWHGTEDLIVPAMLSRYISQNLPWVQYHEIADAGHLFPLAEGMTDHLFRKLLIGDQ